MGKQEIPIEIKPSRFRGCDGVRHGGHRHGQGMAPGPVVGDCRSPFAKACDRSARWSADSLEPAGVDRHPVRDQDRVVLGNPPGRVELRLRDIVLAVSPGLAGGWNLALDPRLPAGEVDRRVELDSSSVRAVFGGTKSGPNPTDRGKTAANNTRWLTGRAFRL